MPEPHNVFAGAYVDRAAEFRTDPRWQATALRQEHTRFVLVNGGTVAAVRDTQRLALLPASTAGFSHDPDDSVFLGLHDGAPVFALLADSLPSLGGDDVDFIDLRELGRWLPAHEANLAAHAVGMARWRQGQRFCARCGSATKLEAAGYASRCTNEACGNRTFPRVDPAIIVLVSHEQRCLLGRQPSWREGLFSTIAGFVEPGESLEDAVAREVYEETNIKIRAVSYHSSQPWPFPSSLMVGFHAHATSFDIHCNDNELEDVRWFTRDDIRERRVKIPPRQSIARQLIDTWVHAGE
ncbi:MAG: NAD(+) diphosphatase [Pseudomonadota bacterium]